MPPHLTVPQARARLAAIYRHRPNDEASILEARRELVVAQAAVLAAKAARLLQGGEPT